MKIERKKGLKEPRLIHNKVLFYIIIFLLAVLIVSVIVLRVEIIKQKNIQANNQTNLGGAQLANPASVYCINNSGTLEIKTDASGGQVGICTLSNGKTCEEWAYFRGECENYSLATTSCSIDSDCVASTCCHPGSCVNKNSAPDCSGVACTMSCEPGTLDCGQASCNCVNKKCVAKTN